jgi:ribosomal protein S17E
MGRIKSALVKRTARGVVKETERFTEKFDDNKLVLGNSMPSKRLRNMIAGYVARIKRMQREKKEIKVINPLE